ncbi:hypothetical protein [Stieleria varia]|uniref:Uncharacterized protein n=1 Tax=Stieleria varia TaxID=2528005 RepID=A0A5C6ANH2_9BACT|nr:hypothetical protein [Stieleria varia]TWT87055.1 hypothetical protein Pla52n_70280 [Stieleria varia]TWU01058.1 hypothetical protein Pla52n_44290 [Stieleria varia]
MIRRSKAVHGDVIQIPVDDTFAYVRVVHVSKHFRDVMQLEFRGFAPSYEQLAPTTGIHRPRWTACTGFAKRGWNVVSAGETSSDDGNLTFRIVANELWRCDELVRHATKRDTAEYPLMTVDGFIFLERWFLKQYNGA